jgi:hypothetical protein
MTEASSADGLERALALCALAFSNAGREGCSICSLMTWPRRWATGCVDRRP